MGQYAIKALQQSGDPIVDGEQAEQDCTGEYEVGIAAPVVVLPVKGQPWLGVEKPPVGKTGVGPVGPVGALHIVNIYITV